MNMPEEDRSSHVLVVDDSQAIHHDFQKILSGARKDAALERMSAELFGQPTDEASPPAVFRIDFACQGEDALRLVQQSLQSRQPYALAFNQKAMSALRAGSGGVPIGRSAKHAYGLDVPAAKACQACSIAGQFGCPSCTTMR
jgi:hypothetical protein